MSISLTSSRLTRPYEMRLERRLGHVVSSHALIPLFPSHPIPSFPSPPPSFVRCKCRTSRGGCLEHASGSQAKIAGHRRAPTTWRQTTYVRTCSQHAFVRLAWSHVRYSAFCTPSLTFAHVRMYGVADINHYEYTYAYVYCYGF